MSNLKKVRSVIMDETRNTWVAFALAKQNFQEVLISYTEMSPPRLNKRLNYRENNETTRRELEAQSPTVESPTRRAGVGGPTAAS